MAYLICKSTLLLTSFDAFKANNLIILSSRIGTPEVAQLVANISALYSPELEVGVTPACCSDHQVCGRYLNSLFVRPTFLLCSHSMNKASLQLKSSSVPAPSRTRCTITAGISANALDMIFNKREASLKCRSGLVHFLLGSLWLIDYL